ncbi:bifunctional phosphoserine phosphatase/homoserine phosphotransferase ThrH [Epibacterium ulvae]|uniref:bifunctional phosphoserine phosphatase/homoserine phosphotransferase ThrH n=1 Tax=Epibacterium ulvae TaxID=1156985 RepID=UPI0024904F9F|nr:bifunctional phosphoserine phosphatase/homoserine phosphotransferase ThrH [Epibacterium ulvae]
MRMVCLDVEGVLFPEIWQAIAAETGIEVLKRTTRDEPDYKILMAERLAALKEADISYQTLISVAKTIEPLPGAAAFLDRLRAKYQVALISDSYYEFLQPLSAKIGRPAIYCHRLFADGDGTVGGWKPRLQDQKPKCVKAFQALGFEIFAAGDSHNDLGMLAAADHAALVHAPAHICDQHPELTHCADHTALEHEIETANWQHQAVA